MSTESPESGLVIRVNDRAVSVSREDADQISSAGGVVVEILESLLKLTIAWALYESHFRFADGDGPSPSGWPGHVLVAVAHPPDAIAVSLSCFSCGLAFT